MHSKVAKRYLDTVLCNYLQTSVSDARIFQNKLTALTERALALINDSPQKEEIYKDAGDLIFQYQTALEDLKESLSVLAYISGKLTLTDAAHDVNPALRKELEKSLEG